MCKGKKLWFCIIAVLSIQAGFSQTAKPATTTATVQSNQKEEVPFLGEYSLYSGIPTIYIGRVVIMKEGKYKVAFGTDENAFEKGTFKYDAATGTIQWITGLFQRNKWKGKLVKKADGYRIEYNKITFAETD